MTVLILGDKNTPGLQCISNFLKTHVDLLWLDAQDIIHNLVIDDVIGEEGSVELNWTISGRTLHVNNVDGVVNGLYFLEDHLFDHVHDEDKKYCQAEFHAYLLFALSQFKNVMNPPYGGGVSGYYGSLPYQWLLVAKTCHALRVPAHYFGQKSEIPIAFLANKNCVYSTNMFDGKWWDTTVPSHDNDTSSLLFCYERPFGSPIIVTALDNHYWSYDVYANDAYSDLAGLNLFEDIAKLMQFFHYRYATILLFIHTDDGQITFGSIEPTFDLAYLTEVHKQAFLTLMLQKLTCSGLAQNVEAALVSNEGV